MRYFEIINESKSAPLYHGYNKIEYAILAIKNNEMLGTTTQRWWPNGIERKLDNDPGYHDSYWMKGISFSRDINYSLQWGTIVFELDQYRLNQNYKIIPFSWNKTINSKNSKREREEFLILEKEPDNYFIKGDEYDAGPYRTNSLGQPILDMKRFNTPANKKVSPLSKYLTGIFISKHFYEVASIRNGYAQEYALFEQHPLFKGIL